jgi:hypothetical protein
MPEDAYPAIKGETSAAVPSLPQLCEVLP